MAVDHTLTPAEEEDETVCPASAPVRLKRRVEEGRV
jgi:hypothetical protein